MILTICYINEYILLSLTIAAVISMGIIAPIFAQQTTLDLTAPVGDKISDGKKRILDLNVKNDNIIATAQMTKPVAEGHVYEGWFEDKGDASGYSLSVGKFDGNGTLASNQTMVNPHTYILCFLSVLIQNKTQIPIHPV